MSASSMEIRLGDDFKSCFNVWHESKAGIDFI